MWVVDLLCKSLASRYRVRGGFSGGWGGGVWLWE